MTHSDNVNGAFLTVLLNILRDTVTRDSNALLLSAAAATAVDGTSRSDVNDDCRVTGIANRFLIAAKCSGR